MRCGARVAEALSRTTGSRVDVDWETGTALVTHPAEFDINSLTQAVESAAHGTHHDYKVLECVVRRPGRR